VLAQRLSQDLQLLPDRVHAQPEVAMELGMTPEDASLKKFFYGKGCEKCNNTGYKAGWDLRAARDERELAR